MGQINDTLFALIAYFNAFLCLLSIFLIRKKYISSNSSLFHKLVKCLNLGVAVILTYKLVTDIRTKNINKFETFTYLCCLVVTNTLYKIQ
jgi:hypothetical protein